MATKGFGEALALLDRIPLDAKSRLKDMLEELAVQTSADQKAALDRQTNGTGKLGAGLGWEELLSGLRFRMGLIKVKSRRNRLFYGLFVEKGRHAQVVQVRRRRRVETLTPKGRKKRVLRTGSNGHKLAEDIVSTYPMRVRAMKARPFINLPGRDIENAKSVAQFWADVLGG